MYRNRGKKVQRQTFKCCKCSLFCIKCVAVYSAYVKLPWSYFLCAMNVRLILNQHIRHTTQSFIHLYNTTVLTGGQLPRRHKTAPALRCPRGADEKKRLNRIHKMQRGYPRSHVSLTPLSPLILAALPDFQGLKYL